MKFLYTLVAVCVLTSGCAKARAKTAPDAPLDMPLPPPREVETPEAGEAPPPVPLVTEPARALPPRPRPTPPREQPRAEPKPDPSKAEAPKPPEPPPAETKPAEEPHAPPTTLQTTPATAEGVVERNVRATLTRAGNELNRIDTRGLNPDARMQYDTAKRFIRQAEDAVKSKNLVFAKNLADKAASIADQLAGR
jgi:outer membrane biosynthesis protein TonB